VDAALRGDRVRPPRRVVVGEDLHPVALLAERGRRRRAGQAGADDDHVELPPVVRRDELHVELVVRPLVGEGTRRDVAVELADHPWASSYSMQLTMTSPSTRQSGFSSALTRPVSTEIGNMMLTPATRAADRKSTRLNSSHVKI